MALRFLLRWNMDSMLDTIIRVPVLFFMDAFMNNSTFGLWSLHEDQSLGNEITGENTYKRELAEDYEVSEEFSTFSSFVRFLGFIVVFVIFLLPTHKLIGVYKWLMSVCAVFGINWVNTMFLEEKRLNRSKTSASACFRNFGLHFFILSIFNLVFTCTHNGKRSGLIQRLLTFVIISPSFINLKFCDHENYWVSVVPTFSVAFLVLFVIINTVLSIPLYYLYIHHSMVMTGLIVRHNSFHIFVENEWHRLRVPSVLRLFWLIRFAQHLIFLKGNINVEEEFTNPQPILDIFMNDTKKLLISGCDTLVAVLGLTSVVAYITHYLCSAVQRFLIINDGEEKSFGTVSAILFLILALQTSLTGLEPEKRFVRLCRNFWLLSTAILHFFHGIVSPILLSLSASRNPSLKHHGRALLVCTFLIWTPTCILYYLWSVHVVGTWLLAVTTFSIEVIIKVLISLLIYALFMIDAYRNTFWEKLDDYVYYVRAIGNTIEFIFGVFLFCNGTWILVFESGGTIRAGLMCIHAYFNIWMPSKSGWEVFMRRRTAVNKINSFPEASPEQLAKFDDVCAICYQEMTAARITVCHHFFHALCLRKWLYIQDRCPMCHKALNEMESQVKDELVAEDLVQQNDGAPNLNEGMARPQPAND